MARPSVRTPEEKLFIVLAVLRGELSIGAAARREGLSKTTIGRWRDDFLEGGRHALATPARSVRPEDELTAETPEDGPTFHEAAGANSQVQTHYEPDPEVHQGGYLATLRKHWLLIVLIVAVAVTSAIAYSALSTKQFSAEADLVVSPIPSTDSSLVGFNILQQSSDPSTSVLTAARLVKTPQVADAVRSQLGLSMSRQALLDSVSVQPVSQSNILAIVASAPTSPQAARIANAFAAEIIKQRSEQFQTELTRRLARLRVLLRTYSANSSEADAIRTQIATLAGYLGQPDPTLHVAKLADPPSTPSSPRPVLSIVIALVAALLVGLGVALGIEMLDPRVNSEDELLLGHRLPVLTRVPRMRRKKVHDYLAGRGDLPEETWEAYRMLRANLATAGRAGGFPKTILMTSAIRGEGKTFSTVNLAITLAAAGTSVIAVDGDLRHPMLATVFGAPSGRNGFADVFMGNEPVERALVPAPGHNNRIRLVLASAGDTLADQLEMHHVRHGLDRLKAEADVVIVDSAALTEVAGALTMAAAVEAVLVVTRLGHTRPDELAELRHLLAYRRINPAGFIVTGRRRRGAHRFALSHVARPRVDTARARVSTESGQGSA